MKLENKTHCTLPTDNGDFEFHLFTEKTPEKIHEHFALIMGDVKNQTDVLLRIHSECSSGDIFGCQRCDCQDQLHASMDMIKEKTQGVLLYLRQEGRGIGIENKMNAYNLQDKGLDTVEANIALGFEADYRTYDIATEMLKHFQIDSVNILSNNPEKIQQLEASGIPVTQRIPLIINSETNDRTELFKTKQKKLGHLFGDLDAIKGNTPVINTPYKFTHSDFINGSDKASEETIELSEKIKLRLQDELQDDLSLLLLQGSNMRGDGDENSDHDYICILKNINRNTTTVFSKIKKEFPDTDFFYVSEEEYHSYPPHLRLQFFLSRTIDGTFDLEAPPTKDEILQTAVHYALQFKDALRPLIPKLSANPNDQVLLDQSKMLLKRFDDCFLRIVCLYSTDIYPLNRDVLRDSVVSNSINQITQVIDGSYSQELPINEVLQALENANRLSSLFLKRFSRNKY